MKIASLLLLVITFGVLGCERKVVELEPPKSERELVVERLAQFAKQDEEFFQKLSTEEKFSAILAELKKERDLPVRSVVFQDAITLLSQDENFSDAKYEVVWLQLAKASRCDKEKMIIIDALEKITERWVLNVFDYYIHQKSVDSTDVDDSQDIQRILREQKQPYGQSLNSVK